MYYNLILTSVNSIFDCLYFPGKDISGDLCGTNPNQRQKKTFSAYGATDSSALPINTQKPVKIEIIEREKAPKNKPTSTENHDHVAPPTSLNSGVEEFLSIGDEYTDFYDVNPSGNINFDQDDFTIGY
jgi:hypothetical protein